MKESRKNKEKVYKKNLIIDVAENLFFERGFKETSMDMLAKEVGFTKRTVYSYFGSKDEVYYEVMLRAYKSLNMYINKNTFNSRINNEVDRIKEFGKVLINFNAEHPAYFKAIFDFENREVDVILKNKVAMTCYEEGQNSVEILLKCLKEGVKKGEIKDNIDINKTFIVLWASVVGITNLINYKKDYIKNYLQVDLYEALDYSFELILNSIRKEN